MYQALSPPLKGPGDKAQYAAACNCQRVMGVGGDMLLFSKHGHASEEVGHQF